MIGDLIREGLLSDARFAEAFTRARCERGQGPLRIEAGLRERGVDGGLIDECLRGGGAPDWPALARAARCRRFGEEVPADFPERARQARFLRMRGFTEGQLRDALASDELS